MPTYVLDHALTARQRAWMIREIVDACADHADQPDVDALQRMPDDALLNEAVAYSPALREKLIAC
jgi:predicted oxidoreductase